MIKKIKLSLVAAVAVEDCNRKEKSQMIRNTRLVEQVAIGRKEI